MIEIDMWELLGIEYQNVECIYIYIYVCVCVCARVRTRVVELWMCIEGKIVWTYMCNNRGMKR
jgi:hypothetical protein